MSEVTKPILLDETGQTIVSKLVDIKNAIEGSAPAGEPVFITVVTPPTKTQYGILETFDPTGMPLVLSLTMAHTSISQISVRFLRQDR